MHLSLHVHVKNVRPLPIYSNLSMVKQSEAALSDRYVGLSILDVIVGKMQGVVKNGVTE